MLRLTVVEPGLDPLMEGRYLSMKIEWAMQKALARQLMKDYTSGIYIMFNLPRRIEKI
jgi:hypothetical protein